MKRCANILQSLRHAPVAQLDRVTDYESVGRGFESLPAYQNIGYPFRGGRCFFYQCKKDSRRLRQRKRLFN